MLKTLELTTQLEARLQFIYKEKYTADLLEKVEDLMRKYGNSPKPCYEKWNEEDIVLITYGDSIKTDKVRPLKTLKRFLDKELKEELTVVHILPFFPYSSDDGFSVIDFRAVNPDLGDWRDVEAITERFDLMADLVVNHASSQGEWFQNFLKGQGKGSDYFVLEDPEKDLSDVVRPRSTPLLTPYQTANGEKHVWTTFSADQVDLDFRNPDLLIEMLDIVLQYVKKGARIIRLDAIAFLWKEIGTTCLHLPETHEVVKLMRDVTEYVDPRVIILTETNVPNKENLSYFGKGDEAHMVYQFSLPPLLLHALHTGNSKYINQWASDLPDPGENGTFFNFTASHDGIGVRPLEGLLPEEEKQSLFGKMKEFGGRINMRSNKDGSTSPYELNITYFDALKGTKDGEDEFQVERFLASQTIMMSFKGVPAFYIHSLTATPNYDEGVEETGENRTINRRKWDKDTLCKLLTSDTPNRAVFWELKRRIQIRKKQPAFHPKASQRLIQAGEGILAFERALDKTSIMVITNLTAQKQTFEFVGYGLDLLSGKKCESAIELHPYQTIWLD